MQREREKERGEHQHWFVPVHWRPCVRPMQHIKGVMPNDMTTYLGLQYLQQRFPGFRHRKCTSDCRMRVACAILQYLHSRSLYYFGLIYKASIIIVQFLALEHWYLLVIAMYWNTHAILTSINVCAHTVSMQLVGKFHNTRDEMSGLASVAPSLGDNGKRQHLGTGQQSSLSAKHKRKKHFVLDVT